MPRRLLILGLGNDILTDDAIGLRVVHALRPELADLPAIALEETTEMGLALLDYLTGYSAAFIVDSIQTGRAQHGFIHELDACSLRQLTGGTPHFLGVGETLALGDQLGLPMPDEVKIFAIETQDPFTLGTRMTPALEAALPEIVERIAQAARSAVSVKPIVVPRSGSPRVAVGLDPR
jgi:hydrogenase maturation protease